MRVNKNKSLSGPRLGVSKSRGHVSIRALLLIAIVWFGLTLNVFAESEVTPLDVVNVRMEAYNNHDLDAFLNAYSKDVQIHDFPNIPIGKAGHDHLRFIFESMFAEKSVSVTLHEQIEQGDYVINHETVTNNNQPTKYVSIYQVEDGLITNVWFVRD